MDKIEIEATLVAQGFLLRKLLFAFIGHRDVEPIIEWAKEEITTDAYSEDVVIAARNKVAEYLHASAASGGFELPTARKSGRSAPGGKPVRNL